MTLAVDLQAYLSKLASADSTPGGGSAAMVSGALGCALVAMVARICAASPKYASVHDHALALIERADSLRERFLALREQDEAAFEAVVRARGDAPAMQNALADAAAAPLAGAAAALEALRLSADALSLKNAHVVSDLGCAAEFSYACLAACAYNVRINHKFMKNEPLVTSQFAELTGYERESQAIRTTVRAAVDGALAAR